MGRPTLWITLWKRFVRGPKSRMELGPLGRAVESAAKSFPVKTSTWPYEGQERERIFQLQMRYKGEAAFVNKSSPLPSAGPA
jgi:hypothetical protein